MPRGLQYRAEKLNVPENPDFHPLVRSVIELRERVKEHVMFTKWDIIQRLRESQSWWLLASGHKPAQLASERMDPPLPPRPTPVGNQPVEQNTSFMGATTQTASPAMSSVELTRPITPPGRMEEENQ